MTGGEKYYPVHVMDNVTDVSAGPFDASAYAVKSDGTLWAWGANAYGQLGNNSTTYLYTPTPVVGITGNVIKVSAGYSHVLALTGDGSVLGMGR